MKDHQGNQTIMTTLRLRRCRTSLLPSRAATVAAMLLIATCSQIHSISAIDDNFDNNNSMEENPLLSSGGRRRLAVRRGGRVRSRQLRFSIDGDEQHRPIEEEAEIITPSESSSENVEDIITNLLGNYQMTNEMKGSIMKPKMKNHTKDQNHHGKRDEPSTQKTEMRKESFPLPSVVVSNSIHNANNDESAIIRNEIHKGKDDWRLENKNRKAKSLKSSNKGSGPEKKAKAKMKMEMKTTKDEEDGGLLTVDNGGYRMEPFNNDADSEAKKNSRKTTMTKEKKINDDQEDDTTPVHDEYEDEYNSDNTKKKISVIRKSSTYNGDYIPVGTVDISYYPDIGTAAYVLNVDGLDPTCSSASGIKGSGTNKSKSNRANEVDNDAHCLCGYCTDCTALTDPTEIANCNALDSCMFVGHGFARPHSLYLKLDPPDQYLNQISVFFKQAKAKKKKKKSSSKGSTSSSDDTTEELECNNIIVNRDENTGLFLVEKPMGCQDDKKPGIGTEVSIDYDGDGEVDVSIHASCSVPLYAGMAIADSPFVIEGYCLGEEEDNGGRCTHLDDQPSESVCSAGEMDMEKDTYSPTMTFMPTTYYPTTSLSPSSAEPTGRPTTGSPTSSPTSTPTTAEPTGRPTVSPTTGSPTSLPTSTPTTAEPTVTPTTGSPTSVPTSTPTTAEPTKEPTEKPTPSPTTSSPITPPPTGRVVLTPLPTPPPTSFPTMKPTIPIRTPIPIQTPLPGMTQFLFDPTSNLVTYTSDDCGPRGKDAYFNNLNECPDGFVLIERGGIGIEDQEIVVDGCRYFSYQVFRCLSPRTTPLTGRQPVMMEHPHSSGGRALMEDNHRGSGSSFVHSRTLSVGVESHVPFSYFDPADSLVGYISDNCGPRGAYALADLEQCEPAGHEKVEWVPWQDGKPIVNVDGCLYFSFEVYECLPAPRVDILDNQSDYGDDIALVGPDDVAANEEYIESDMSCAVAVAEGSCDKGGEGIGGVFVGTTSDATLLVEDSYYDGEQLDGKVMLFHDYDGTVIGCGTIRPII